MPEALSPRTEKTKPDIKKLLKIGTLVLASLLIKGDKTNNQPNQSEIYASNPNKEKTGDRTKPLREKIEYNPLTEPEKIKKNKAKELKNPDDANTDATPNQDNKDLSGLLDAWPSTPEHTRVLLSNTTNLQLSIVETLRENKRPLPEMNIMETKNTLGSVIDSLIIELNGVKGKDFPQASMFKKKLENHKAQLLSTIDNINGFKNNKKDVLDFLQKEYAGKIFASDPKLRELQKNITAIVYELYQNGQLKNMVDFTQGMGLINNLKGFLAKTIYETPDLYGTIQTAIDKNSPDVQNKLKEHAGEESVANIINTQDAILIYTILDGLKKTIEEKGSYFMDKDEASIQKEAEINNNSDSNAKLFTKLLAENPNLVKMYKKLISLLSKR